MKHHKCTAVFVLAAIITVALFSAIAYGADVPTSKDEIIYGTLRSDGSVDHIYVVNAFTDKNKIVDYGDYSEVRNMTTTDELIVNGDEISVSMDAVKLYYQGNLKTADLPWKVNIHYYMNGQEYTADQIAGLSGKLKITIAISQNKACNEHFWNGYSLQINAVMDSYRTNNLQSEGATVADVGSDKQLSYIVLPGKEKDIEINADVTDFEMDAITINGMRLNLDVDLDQTELNDKITELQNAVSSLDNGAGELTEGTENLYDGTKKLSEGASNLNDGMQRLSDGIGTIESALAALNAESGSLSSGSKEMMTALKTLQSALKDISLDTTKLTELSEASEQIKGGIDDLVTGLQTMDGSINTYNADLNEALKAAGITGTEDFAEKNSRAASSLEEIQKALASSDPETAEKIGEAVALLKADSAYISGSSKLINGIDSSLDSSSGELMTGALALQLKYKEFDSNIQSMTTALSSMSEKLVLLKTAIDTINSNYQELDAGVDAYTGAVNQINDGYQQIYIGAVTAASGTKALYSSTETLVNGAGSLLNGMKTLKSGTGQFAGETAHLDTDVTDMIDTTIDNLTGSNEPVISFVSDKNTNVSSVLFVMNTQAIEKPAEDVREETETEETGFIQKVIDLFRDFLQ